MIVTQTFVNLASLLAASVVFLYAADSGSLLGTGFVVWAPVPGREDLRANVLVTARHVISERRAVTVRFSTVKGKPAQVDFDLADLRRHGHLWFHPDQGVDLAAFPFPYAMWTTYRAVPWENVADSSAIEERRVGPLDRVAIPGLLSNYPGELKNLPIVRDGSVALIPDEPIPMLPRYGKLSVRTRQPVLLLNTMVFPGASGSPVFLWPPSIAVGDSTFYAGEPLLIGVISGYYPSTTALRENSGIAVATPAWRIRQILTSDQVAEELREIGAGK